MTDRKRLKVPLQNDEAIKRGYKNLDVKMELYSIKSFFLFIKVYILSLRILK